MAPKDTDDGVEAEREPANKEDTDRTATSTPETALVTPVSGAMRHMPIKAESPTPEDKLRRGLSLEAGPVATDVKPKKRARVAFA